MESTIGLSRSIIDCLQGDSDAVMCPPGGGCLTRRSLNATRSALSGGLDRRFPNDRLHVWRCIRSTCCWRRRRSSPVKDHAVGHGSIRYASHSLRLSWRRPRVRQPRRVVLLPRRLAPAPGSAWPCPHAGAGCHEGDEGHPDGRPTGFPSCHRDRSGIGKRPGHYRAGSRVHRLIRATLGAR